MSRFVVTVDAYGQSRSGPDGAWWSNLQPRPGAGGFSPELPAGRAAAWNLSFAVLILSSVLAVHFLAGTPWLTIGAVLGGGVLLGVVLGVLAYRTAQYQDPWQRFLREQAKAEAAQVRPSLPIRATGERAA